jgi:hypothetical protein
MKSIILCTTMLALTITTAGSAEDMDRLIISQKILAIAA